MNSHPDPQDDSASAFPYEDQTGELTFSPHIETGDFRVARARAGTHVTLWGLMLFILIVLGLAGLDWEWNAAHTPDRPASTVTHHSAGDTSSDQPQ